MNSKYTPNLITLLLIALCFTTNNVKANDTLTFRQVYSFNVGDTFDYAYEYAFIDGGFYGTNYYRKIIVGKTYSPNLDTLYLQYSFPYGGGSGPYDTIVNLDSIAVFQYPKSDTSCGLQFIFNDTTYPNHLSNNLNVNCFESGGKYRYTKGLGRSLYSWSTIGSSGLGSDGSTETLIYYANDSTRFGTPYYIANGSNLVADFIPLPETCAVWIRKVSGKLTPIDTIYGNVTEEIRTGNKINVAGRNYVELICRIENGITGHFTPDSLIGYFYNDTPAKIAYFVHDTGQTPVVLCTFNMLAGYNCGNSSILIDSILIGGSYRTEWYCPQSGPSYNCIPNIIAGIGNLDGLIPINQLWNYGYPACGSLTCFSVCGQTLYPNDTLASCPQLTSIKNINKQGFSLQYSPNPFSTSISVNVYTEKYSTITYTVNDMIGKTVYTATDIGITGSNTKKIDLSTLSAGVYLLTVSVNGEALERKIVKE